MPTPRSLARACALHPKRTLLAWAVVLVLSFGCIATMLDLSSEGDLTGNPESRRAERLVFANRLFERQPVTEVVIVRSERHAVTDPAFRHFVDAFSTEIASGGVEMRPAG